MDIKELKELALHAANRTAPSEFTVSNVDDALADEMKAMCGSINNFMKNRYDIYDIIIETADKVVPQRVIDAMGTFAEIRVVANGDTVMFKRGPIGRFRAKKFLTQVGLAGVYESFRLDSETFKISTKAIGGAVTLDFQRFIDGAENLSDFMQVLTDSQVDGIYFEVQKALMTAKSNQLMPARNKYAGAYDPNALVKVINTVKAYGGGATIFAPPEFIAAMGPDVISPTIAWYPTGVDKKPVQDDIDAIHRNGRIQIFRGVPVVELKQSFLDEHNTQIMINPQYAYILPTGNDKVVKVVLEGDTQMYDHTNRDQSIEINTYKMIGVGILHFNNWGVYQNTGIDASDWYDGGYFGIDVDLRQGDPNSSVM